MARSPGRIPRLFVADARADGAWRLTGADAHYLSNVLRLKTDDSVVIFNGRGDEWSTRVVSQGRGATVLELIDRVEPLAESPLSLDLVQALVKSDAMDRIVQKATELGVTTIRPVSMARSVVNVKADRSPKKLAHWRKIARHACEQSGRHSPPRIHEPAGLASCLKELGSRELVLALDTGDDIPAQALPEKLSSVAVIVGPEGGYSPAERELLTAAGCRFLSLGRRILRADTAAISICSLLQNRWGDLR